MTRFTSLRTDAELSRSLSPQWVGALALLLTVLTGCGSSPRAPVRDIPQACCVADEAQCVLGLPHKEGDRCRCPDPAFTSMIAQWRSFEEEIAKQEARVRALERQPVNASQQKQVADAKALVQQQRVTQGEFLRILQQKRDEALASSPEHEVGEVCREPLQQ